MGELGQGQVAKPQQMEELQQVDLLCIVSMEAGIPGCLWWPRNHERRWLIVFGILQQIRLLKIRGVQVREAETKQGKFLKSSVTPASLSEAEIPVKTQNFPYPFFFFSSSHEKQEQKEQ